MRGRDQNRRAENWSLQRTVRAAFYAAMPVFLLAGLYSGLRLWYCLLLTEVFTVLLIFAVDLWTVYTFRFTQTLSTSEAVKGEICSISLSIMNEKPFPLSMMEIEMETVSPDDRVTLRMSLPPFGSSSFTVPMTLPYRGIYEAGMTTVRITDFFGLLPFSFDMRRLPYYRLPKLTVFPRAELPVETSGRLRDSKNAGFGRLPLSGGETPAGAREFVPGDALRRVHWSKTAQMGRLYTREYEAPRREALYILLDNSLPEDVPSDSEQGRVLFDTLCEAAADLTLLGLSGGHPVEVHCTIKRPGCPDRADAEELRGFPAVHRMLAEVMAVAAGGEALLQAVSGLRAETDGYVFILTGNAGRTLQRTLERSFGGGNYDLTLVQAGARPVPTEGIHSLWLAPGENVRAGLEAIG